MEVKIMDKNNKIQKFEKAINLVEEAKDILGEIKEEKLDSELGLFLMDLNNRYDEVASE